MGRINTESLKLYLEDAADKCKNMDANGDKKTECHNSDNNREQVDLMMRSAHSMLSNLQFS